ncbi:hypothetical protein DSECCO2_582560 [anaerobic digester metagenome]
MVAKYSFHNGVRTDCAFHTGLVELRNHHAFLEPVKVTGILFHRRIVAVGNSYLRKEYAVFSAYNSEETICYMFCLLFCSYNA